MQVTSSETAAEDGDSELFKREWDVPAHAHVLPVCLVIVMVVLWLKFGRPSGMESWATSLEAIHEGNAKSIVLHMFAHASAIHLTLNMLALLVLGGPLISRLGQPPLSWIRYLYLFLGSGLAGAALFLVLSRNDARSMIGASGAIFGMLGALARVHPVTGEMVAIRSTRTWSMIKFFLQNHLVLFVLLAIIAFFTGSSAFVAWQAHLGGLLFGFFITPLYLPRPVLASQGSSHTKDD